MPAHPKERTQKECPRSTVLATAAPPQSTPSALFDDCERPACDDMVTKLKQMSLSSSAMANKAVESTKVQCPPSSGEIGKGSWNLLHSMVAWYPEKPSEKDRFHMNQFFESFARFYPCPWCAKDFQENLQKQPVQTSSRVALCQWLCEQHNMVNEKLGKPLFPCDMKSLDERWRKSSKEDCKNRGH